METVRAVKQMGIIEAAQADNVRSPAGIELARRVPHLAKATSQAIRLLAQNGITVADDLPSQARLAAALDRQTAIGDIGRDTHSMTRSIMNDVLIQEHAAERLGKDDPLYRPDVFEIERPVLNAAQLLYRGGINATAIINRASPDDTAHIAAGRFDKIEAEHTKFAIQTNLNYSEEVMATRIPAIQPQAVEAAKIIYPSGGFGKGPAPRAVASFGRKVGAER